MLKIGQGEGKEKSCVLGVAVWRVACVVSGVCSLARLHARHQSDHSVRVADEAARSLKSPRRCGARQRTLAKSSINVGGVNGRGRNTLAAVGAVLKIVESMTIYHILLLHLRPP